jgi:hypothetical protein
VRRRPSALLFGAVALLGLASAAAPDWPAWFAKNTTVTDKKSYVHFFWNANDVRSRFEGPGREAREALVAEAARQLVVREYPAKATADRVRVDVVFVTERDAYGMPKWDSLKRVAHVEASRRKLLAAPQTPEGLRKAFDRFELY